MAKRKKVKVPTGSLPNSDINVTPLVDVVLVLLIIFMVVTPLLEKDIEVKVPDTEKTDVVTDVPPDQIVVGITPAGELTINMEKISDAEYETRLKRILAAKAKGDRLVFFMPSEKTSYAKVVMALDVARQSGAETLGMMTEEMPTPPGGVGTEGGGAAPEGGTEGAPTPTSTAP